MTPAFPTTRQKTRRETRRPMSLTIKENAQTRRPDANHAPVCANVKHQCAMPRACSAHVALGRARVWPSGARIRAGLRPSGHASGCASGVGSAPARVRLHSLLPTCEKKKGAGLERTSDRASLAPSVFGRLAMGSSLAAPGQLRLPAGRMDLSAAMQGRSSAVERPLVSNKPLRVTMPATAAFIDDLRAAFGAEMINTAIRAGLDGQPTFWASENGQQVGTRCQHDPANAVSLAEIHLGPINPDNPKQMKGKR